MNEPTIAAIQDRLNARIPSCRAEIANALITARDDVRTLLRELDQLCPRGDTVPGAAIETLFDEIAKLKERVRELEAHSVLDLFPEGDLLTRNHPQNADICCEYTTASWHDRMLALDSGDLRAAKEALMFIEGGDLDHNDVEEFELFVASHRWKDQRRVATFAAEIGNLARWTAGLKERVSA